MIERTLELLVEHVAKGGPYVAGIIFVWLVMVWAGGRRRGEGRNTDTIIMFTGVGIILILAAAMGVEFWKGF